MEPESPQQIKEFYLTPLYKRPDLGVNKRYMSN